MYGEFVEIVKEGKSKSVVNGRYVSFSYLGIYLGYRKKNNLCPGSFIHITGSSYFKMGEVYMSGFLKNNMKMKWQEYYYSGEICEKEEQVYY